MLANRTIHFSVGLGLLIGIALNYLPSPFYITIMTVISIGFFSEVRPFRKICPVITAIIFSLMAGMFILTALKLVEDLLIDVGKYVTLFRIIRISICIFYTFFLVKFIFKNKTNVIERYSEQKINRTNN